MISNSLIHLRFRLLSELYSLLSGTIEVYKAGFSISFRLLSELYSLLSDFSTISFTFTLFSGFRLLSELYSLLFEGVIFMKIKNIKMFPSPIGVIFSLISESLKSLMM